MRGFLTLAELLAWVEYSGDLKARATKGFGVRVLIPESAFPNDYPLLHMTSRGLTMVLTTECRQEIIKFVANNNMGLYDIDVELLAARILPMQPVPRDAMLGGLEIIDQRAAAGNRLTLPRKGMEAHPRPSFVLEAPRTLVPNRAVPLEPMGSHLIGTMPGDMWRAVKAAVQSELSNM